MLDDFQKLGRKRLGGILMAEGLVTPEQVTEALEIQKDTGKILGQVLIELGYITEYDLAKSLATQFQFPYISPTSYAIDRDILEIFNLAEEVKVSKTGLKKVLGRRLAARVVRSWLEDFVDEDTGEVVSIERTEVIIDRETILENTHIDDIVEFYQRNRQCCTEYPPAVCR